MFCLIDDPTPIDFAPLDLGRAYSRHGLVVGTMATVTYDGGATWSNYGPWCGHRRRTCFRHPRFPGTAYVGCQPQGVQVTTDVRQHLAVLHHG